jgi:hypothetical protein
MSQRARCRPLAPFEASDGEHTVLELADRRFHERVAVHRRKAERRAHGINSIFQLDRCPPWSLSFG